MNSFFETISEIYDETRGFPQDVMVKVTEVLKKEIGNKKVLDLGVGTGRFTYPLQKRGINVVGIDISYAMLAKARAKGVRNLVKGDVGGLPFSNSAFNIVLSVHLLHLVEDTNSVLKEIKRVGTDKLISVLFKKSEFDVIKEYKEALSYYGYPLVTSGIGEYELKQMVKPLSILPIPQFKSLLPIKERIKLLEERKHSFSLDTPPEIHADAIRFLRKKHEVHLEGHAKTQIEIAIWNISDLPYSISQ
jgi:ubiquinone/menaquinone biosynthesis C-methylase UbiE